MLLCLCDVTIRHDVYLHPLFTGGNKTLYVFKHIDVCVPVWRACRRLDGGVMAVFNRREMCVFVGDGG